ncbi:MAG: leucyl aminopeptidase family protein [Elioraea sp.]|nr:leucyl aminopeptidase family protein [Elioraea sp.]
MLPCFAPPDTPALPCFPLTPQRLPAWRAAHPAGPFVAATGFAAKAGEVLLLPGEGGLGGALVGLGEGRESAWSFAGLPFALPPDTVWRLELDGALELGALRARAVLGWGLGAYRYSRFKAPPRPPARLIVTAADDAALAEVEVTYRVRDLINHPANHLGPDELAETAIALSERHGASVRVVRGEALADGHPAVAAVGAGSARPPCVVRLDWIGPGGAEAPLIALCGKGVVFDTGGYDLKPAQAMLQMKKDMGGAAVALGVAELVMRAGLPVRLLALIGAVENAIGAHAMRPRDVIRTRKGLTVEIGNTDAEGRLVLADLLAEADAESPDLLLDFATLTGAARVALGPDLVALFARRDATAEALLRSGEAAEDPLWRLPIWPGYASWLDSEVADLGNVSSRPHAGAIVAASFLDRFVSADRDWAHLDLYAWNDSARPGRPEGGEATGMRAVWRSLCARYDSGRPVPPSRSAVARAVTPR